nr:hypothetical protein [Nocardia abscessus]
MAAVPGRGESAAQRLPLDSGGSRRAALPVPAALAPLLPDGGLVKGSVVAYTGASSLLAGLLAAVTESGGHAAVVGMPRLGLLAAVEMGAQLRRLAVISDPGPDPVEVAAVLLDGLDLVVLGLGGGAVAPARRRGTAKPATSNTVGRGASPATGAPTRSSGSTGGFSGRAGSPTSGDTPGRTRRRAARTQQPPNRGNRAAN